MKNSLKFVFVFLVLINQSCSKNEVENNEVLDLKGNLQGSEILIPDENFRNTLINTNCVDTNDDGISDTNVDLNNDGKIQKKEANSVEKLILDFDYGVPAKFVDLKGIENFGNIKSLNISGRGGSLYYDEALNEENLIYDFTALRKLEYLKIMYLATEYFDEINLSGLTKLVEVDLSQNRPMDYYSERNMFITVNLDGCSNLTNLNIVNSFLRIDFCQITSLEKLNMMYLEGGEPEVFDFHCLSNLKWLNISENMIDTLILKNSSLLETFIYDDPYRDLEWMYPSPKIICIDDIPEELEQITPLVGENTIVTTDCSF
ncbi:hypothetical protein [Salinimicrobium soli]|uniref:hypothetical protein n=1 Tax=Salinimicrobium soli TaxID=1254399 RepID=UPI003AABABD9